MPVLTNTEFMQEVADLAETLAHAKDTRRFDQAEITQKIKDRVIGQDQLADAIASRICRVAARKEKSGTLINFVISGPTGTGKTELAKAIAEAVFGDGHLLPIDCGNMGTGEQVIHALIGAPPQFKGDSRGMLIDFLDRTRGNGVILFDEYEKAAPTENSPLAKMLLALLDVGTIHSHYDKKLRSAHGCIVILSSNLKQEEFAEAARISASVAELDRNCRAILTGSMSPEFLGRFDLVVSPAPLSDRQWTEIAAMLLDKLARMHHIDIVAPQPGLKRFLVNCGEQCREQGVRQARGWLEREYEDCFVEAANERRLKAVAADWRDGQLILTAHL